MSIKENGPWKVANWKLRNSQIVLQSDDFSHDVCLTISGDFETKEDEIKYGEALAKALNAVMPLKFE